MELPQEMDSKFRFILVAAKRARQLQSGAKPLVQSRSKKVTRMAMQEVAANLVPFEIFESTTGEDEKSKKHKSSK